MKGFINQNVPNGFKPFSLTLEVETVEEARTLFHIFNNGALAQVIAANRNWYGMENYSKNLSTLTGDNLATKIKKYIESGNSKI